MIRREVVIRDEVGLHARPAALFVKTADRFNVRVTLTKDGIEVNGRSILSLLTLAAESGSTVTLKVEGKNEEPAFEALSEILAGKHD